MGYAMSDETGITQAEFARRLGVSRAHITRLKQAGRLVMDGKRVLPAASTQRMRETADPNRDDLVRRHAAYRAARGGVEPGSGDANGSGTKGADSATRFPDAALDRAGATYTQARAVKERYAALQAKADYERSIASLVDIVDVRNAAKSIGTSIRVTLENLPDELAPELAVTANMEQTHAVLVERMEAVLETISAQTTRYINRLGGADE